VGCGFADLLKCSSEAMGSVTILRSDFEIAKFVGLYLVTL